MVLFHLVYSFLHNPNNRQTNGIGAAVVANILSLTGYDISSMRKRCLLGPLVPLPNASLPLDGLTAFMLPDRWS